MDSGVYEMRILENIEKITVQNKILKCWCVEKKRLKQEAIYSLKIVFKQSTEFDFIQC